MKYLNNIVVLLVFCAFACNDERSNFDKAVHDWQRDSLGCMGLRKNLLGNGQLFPHINYQTIKGHELIKLLGRPNKSDLYMDSLYDRGKVHSILYYTESGCDKENNDQKVSPYQVLQIEIQVDTDSIVSHTLSGS